MSTYHADALANSEYSVTDTIEWSGADIHGRDRMTRDEVQRDLARVERLQTQLFDLGVTVHGYGIHGQLRRVTAILEPGHDPLDNGIPVGNVDGFTVEAVQPQRGSRTQVGIRFQELPERER